ncbi:MAG TPA: Holliday junction branch migration protein RuvA [Nevskiaceae bacterium]|nr:Holliday junction branch migration protein RuvA [Nevskiaceae bacterium]
MIGRLSGRLLLKQPPLLLIDVGGVGYEVEAPMSTFYKLPALGEPVVLLTHLAIAEDAHRLFGFISTAEKTLFRELIRISGVGPKLALSLLSGIGVEEFWSAIRNSEVARLTKVPGIGKKTAERLVVEMRDRAGAPLGSEGLPGAPAAVADSPLQEARAALAALGYKSAEIDRFTQAVHREGMSTEAIIQEALKRAIR